MQGAVERVNKNNSCNTKDELDARIKVEFTVLNMEIIGNAYRRFQSHLEATVEASGKFLE